MTESHSTPCNCGAPATSDSTTPLKRSFDSRCFMTLTWGSYSSSMHWAPDAEPNGVVNITCRTHACTSKVGGARGKGRGTWLPLVAQRMIWYTIYSIRAGKRQSRTTLFLASICFFAAASWVWLCTMSCFEWHTHRYIHAACPHPLLSHTIQYGTPTQHFLRFTHDDHG